MKMLSRVAFLACALAGAPAQSGSVALPGCMTGTSTYVPCGGMVPVDPSGNPLSWSSLFSGISGGAGVAYTGPSASQLPASLGAKAGINSLSLIPATDAQFILGAGSATIGTVNLGTIGGAATSSKQDAGNASLASIDSKLTSPLSVTGMTTSQSWALTQFFAGKCFSFAIPLTSVAVGNYLNVTLTNPAGSGETFVVLERRFSQTTANVLAYNYFINPGAISGTVTSKAGSNQLTSSAVTSALSLNYAVSTTAMTGTAVGAMPIPPNGLENPPIALLRSISPGTSIGYQMGGTGGVLTAASQFTFTLEGCKL